MIVDHCRHGQVGLGCVLDVDVLEIVANVGIDINFLIQHRDVVPQRGQWNWLVGGFLGQFVVHHFKVVANSSNLFVVNIKKFCHRQWRMVMSSVVVQHEASHGFGHVCFCAVEGCTFLRIVVDLGWTHQQQLSVAKVVCCVQQFFVLVCVAFLCVVV